MSIQPTRLQALNDQSIKDGKYALYWMQNAQRAHYNHALEFAIQQANEQRLPLIVLFGLTDRYPEANERHYAFMLEGLRETQQSLLQRGIQMIIRRQSPPEAALDLAQEAAFLVVDRGYVRITREWRARVAREANCPVIQVETDLVVPLETASSKEEWAAATLRPKIARHLPDYLVPLEETPVQVDSLGLSFEGFSVEDVDAALSSLDLDRSVARVDKFIGGTFEALRHLDLFLNEKIKRYADLRNDPSLDYQSHLSPYLHFGQISPLYLALEAQKSPHSAGKEAFLEELIVRRELSANYVFYNQNYDRYEGLPAWAKQTLREYANDLREYLYSEEEFEAAATHDPYWNAAMREMKRTGKMHNYMRMYWGKKILEWTLTPEEGFRIALTLNNKYFLDGRDMNSYTGVAWCFGKHDRPWTERPIFGKIRYMNANGLKRKFDIEAYVRMNS